MGLQGRFKGRTEGKYLVAVEKMIQGKFERKKKPMQEEDGSYRKVENCVTAVNKRHHKLWLIFQFDCLIYYNGNGKVWKVFYEKISDTNVDSI